LKLPSSPLKDTEKRAKRWRETHGHDQTEIDIEAAIWATCWSLCVRAFLA
jgi:hypothetical protein